MLELRNVSASYGDANVIEAVDIRVNAGEIGAILGANGAGKTTILRAIMGYVAKVSGAIIGPSGESFIGRPIHDIARLGVAYVPEGRGILFSLTVRENLLVGATPLRRRDPRAVADRLDAVLDRFPILRERLEQHAGLLSGGQQQMLAIGRALIAAPRVLLLDEPSLGLAPLVRREIADILLRIKATDGPAVLLVEQDVKLAQRAADFACILRRGRLVRRLEAHELTRVDEIRRAYLGEDRSLAHSG